MPPSTGAPITWDGELPRLAVERFTLASGLEVVVHTDRASPMVAVWMGYRVGSSDEGDGDSGFAHLFEHMFKNSLHLGGRHHYQILREAGAARPPVSGPHHPPTPRRSVAAHRPPPAHLPMNCSANCRRRRTDGTPSCELKVRVLAKLMLAAACHAT
jgi:hypothetical protein